jgi:transcriptional regulator with XRE-family HTH domain
MFPLTLRASEGKVKRNPRMSDESTITLAQCRAARALLNLSRDDLADMAEVSVSTIADFERGQRQPYARTLRDIQAALEQAGVMFIAPAEKAGPGVRLTKP